MIALENLEFRIKAEITQEWQEWVSHHISVRLDDHAEEKVVGPLLAKAHIARCIAPYDNGNTDTWDRTEDLESFHSGALTEEFVKEYELEMPLCGQVTYIHKIEVLAAYRRQGIAGHMLQTILDYLVDPSGAVGLTLPKNVEGPWLQKFYEFYGFKRLGKTRHMIKDSTLRCDADMKERI